jgi:hypothetical protein
MEQRAQSPRILAQFKRCVDEGWLHDEDKLRFLGDWKGWRIWRATSMSGGQPHRVRYNTLTGECVCSCAGYEFHQRCTHALLVASAENSTIRALVQQAVSA